MDPIPFAPGYFVEPSGAVWTSSYGRLRKLKPWGHTKYKYPAVTLYVEGHPTSVLVHRIVCTVYNGQAPTPAHEVRHLDGNAQNPHASNLAWGTHAENMADMVRHGTHWAKVSPSAVRRGARHYLKERPELIRRGKDSRAAKLTEEQVCRIRAEGHVPGAQARFAREYGVTPGAIYNVFHRLCWRHLP